MKDSRAERSLFLRLLGESDGRLHAVTFYEPVAWFTDRLKSDEQCAQDIESLCHLYLLHPITGSSTILHPTRSKSRYTLLKLQIVTGADLGGLVRSFLSQGLDKQFRKNYNCLRQVLKINCSFFRVLFKTGKPGAMISEANLSMQCCRRTVLRQLCILFR